MKEYLEIAVAKPESDLADYSSVRVNPVQAYRIDTTLERFASPDVDDAEQNTPRGG